MNEHKGQEMSENELQYEDRSDPRLLDIIDIPVLQPKPEGCQTKNWLLDPEYCWQKVGPYSPFGLSALADPVAALWIDGFSTYNGRNDKIPLESGGEISSTLRLIGVEEVVIHVFAPGEAFGNSKRRVQGRFVHAGETYELWITDPIYERRYLAKLDGTYRIGKCHLTISLGEPYEDFIYKLIAAVIEPDGP